MHHVDLSPAQNVGEAILRSRVGGGKQRQSNGRVTGAINRRLGQHDTEVGAGEKHTNTGKAKGSVCVNKQRHGRPAASKNNFLASKRKLNSTVGVVDASFAPEPLIEPNRT